MKPTEKQINEWKEKHGGVYEFPVEDKTAYLREPNMKDFKRTFAAMQRGGEIAFGEEMLSALWLGGDEQIRTDDDYFLPARKRLADFFDFGEAEITALESRKSKISVNGHSCIVRVVTREDLRIAEKKNPASKPFVTQEKLFEMIVLEKDQAFEDRDNAGIRFPLYAAIERLQNQKVAVIKKL